MTSILEMFNIQCINNMQVIISVIFIFNMWYGIGIY